MTHTAYFAAGCFWGVESAFMAMDGVLDTAVGYMNGTTDNPTYEQVCQKATGHAEAVQVVFDPAVVTYAQLVQAFFKMHNPTTLNRQGPDVGTQYRSGIYTASDEQAAIAKQIKAELDASGQFNSPIVTEIEPAQIFWPAEDYHQQYFKKRGIEATCHL